MTVPSFGAIVANNSDCVLVQQWADLTGWPIVESTDDANDTRFLILFKDDTASLTDRTQPQQKAYCLNFDDPSLIRRVRQFGKKSPLYKSAFSKAGVEAIFDASAGQGTDALCFAFAGAEVIAAERHPVLYLFLLQAFEKAKDHSFWGDVMTRIRFRFGPSDTVYSGLEPDHRPSVVFFDPLFSAIEKKALSRKEMELFRALSGGDSDAAQTAGRLLELAPRRLVIKRPPKAPFLLHPPRLFHKTKSVRFDIYVK